jgi:Bacterial extracellular solute-binding proteins, family 5 Middle
VRRAAARVVRSFGGNRGRRRPREDHDPAQTGRPGLSLQAHVPVCVRVPAGTPLRVARTEPIARTGPCRVARFDPDRELRHVRNPQFAVWSADARPDGYADEIHLRLSDDVAAQVAAVGRGRADVMLGPPVERLKGLLTQYPGRLHSHAVPWTDYMFLNTRAPPFDDLRVRQALNPRGRPGANGRFVGWGPSPRGPPASSCRRPFRATDPTAPTRSTGTLQGRGPLPIFLLVHSRAPRCDLGGSCVSRIAIAKRRQDRLIVGLESPASARWRRPPPREARLPCTRRGPSVPPRRNQ